MPDNSPLPGRHVYLSFTQEDDGTAAEIARDLEQRGIAVRLDRADIAWGESWADHVRSAVKQADTFVLVVSQDSSRHVLDWAQAAEALNRRGIDVVAVAVSGHERHEIAYVGDRLDNDIAPAAEAGLVTVWVRRGPWGYVLRPRELMIAGSLASSSANATRTSPQPRRQPRAHHPAQRSRPALTSTAANTTPVAQHQPNHRHPTW